MLSVEEGCAWAVVGSCPGVAGHRPRMPTRAVYHPDMREVLLLTQESLSVVHLGLYNVCCVTPAPDMSTAKGQLDLMGLPAPGHLYGIPP